MKKKSLLLIYFISFLYMEFLYRILLYKNVFILSNISMICFVFFFALLAFILSKLLNQKGNKIIFYVLLSLIALWFSAQYVVKDFFDFYISFSVFKIAGQVGDFMDKAVLETVKRLWAIGLFFLPVILTAIFNKHLNFKHSTGQKSLILLILLLASYGLYYGSLLIGKNKDYSAYDLYHNVNSPSLMIEKTGVLNTFVVDSYRAIFGFDEKLLLETPDPNDETVETTYDYNVLNIDFTSISENSTDKVIKDMSAYFANDNGTLQNEYTSYFEGKNLILFMAESFSDIAVNELTTPTLYKLVNEGFVFKNFYSPTIYSTIGGEFQELTGLYPASTTELNTFKSGKVSFPMGISTMFENAGYNTYAYHNNSFTFQNRNQYLSSLGFDNFKACYNGLEKDINCQLWPQSDVEMVEATYLDYLDTIDTEKPFMVFYASVSGHASYSWYNAMAKKHKAEIESLGLNYSTPVMAYLASQMELDRALASLLQKLEETGKLEDTVIALVGDHYPYELTIDQVNEAASYTKDASIEVDRSYFVLWNSAMEKVEINKVGSKIDVLPTIYNIFGLPYDSRLIIGKDILSTEDGLVIFKDNSWVTDKGKYFASSGEFILNPGAEVSEDYVKNMNIIVKNKVYMSKYIINKNYYKLAWSYIK